MASAIGPGDWVECVDVGRCAEDHALAARGFVIEETIPRDLAVGSIYCVEQVRIDPDSGELDLRVVGVVADTQTGWFGAFRFRPVYRPRADFIESLKAPPVSAPVRQTEAA